MLESFVVLPSLIFSCLLPLQMPQVLSLFSCLAVYQGGPRGLKNICVRVQGLLSSRFALREARITSRSRASPPPGEKRRRRRRRKEDHEPRSAANFAPSREPLACASAPWLLEVAPRPHMRTPLGGQEGLRGLQRRTKKAEKGPQEFKTDQWKKTWSLNMYCLSPTLLLRRPKMA